MPDDLEDRRAESRISDAEREGVLEHLRAHTAEGRLTLDEFSDALRRCSPPAPARSSNR